MSIVKYKKSNGRIAIYESTQRYDPEKKQARPIRKYLGMEDPVTGELIPAKHRRKKDQPEESTSDSSLLEKFTEAIKKNERLEDELQKVKEELAAYRNAFQRVCNCLDDEKRNLNN